MRAYVLAFVNLRAFVNLGICTICIYAGIVNPRRACAARVTVVVSYVCLSAHAILAVYS